jgi:hypothetical protein
MIILRYQFSVSKIYLYKEDFSAFAEIGDMTSYVLNHKGEEVISERHQKRFQKRICYWKSNLEEVLPNISSFTDIDFDDI